jgi:hypothetical protein
MLRYLYRLPDLYQGMQCRLIKWHMDMATRRWQRAVAEWETLSAEEKHRRHELAMERDAIERAAMMPNPVLTVVAGLVAIVLFGWTLWQCWPELSFHVTLTAVGQELLAQVECLAILGSIFAVMLWLEGKFKLPGQS